MILERIAAATRQRVARSQESVSYREVVDRALALPQGDRRFEQALRQPELAFICEVKRASPSKGLLAPDFPHRDIAVEYESAGAAAISVLTEPEFFQGRDRYLEEIRTAVGVPLLRKDFVVSDYQIYEARLLGADAVLLICALLDTASLARFLGVCEELGLSALVEAHTEDEVRGALAAGASIVGVNNRDLKTFQVDLGTCLRLRPLVPEDRVFVAESGIRTAEDVGRLREAGVHAALIGEALMTSPDKAAAVARLRGGAAR